MWIESHQELRDHPKTKRLARALVTSVPATIGHLHCLWWWAMDYAPQGDLAGYEAWEVAEAAMWDGDPDALVDALRRAGFLDGSLIHDWDHYAGKLLAGRERARERAAKRRAAGAGERSPDVPEPFANGTRTDGERTSLPYQTVPDQTVPERTGERSAPGADAPAPKPVSRETQFPKGWEVPADAIEWALGKGWPRPWIDANTERFTNYYLSRTVKRKDWTAAWRTWLLKEASDRPPVRVIARATGSRVDGSAPARSADAVNWDDESAVFGIGD